MQLGNDFYSVQRNRVRITLYRIQYTTIFILDNQTTRSKDLKAQSYAKLLV